MLQCQCKITVENNDKIVVFDFVNSIEINTSYENLTDTCKIVVPRKITFDGQNLFAEPSPLFKRGDKVKVEIGYVPNLEVVFEGYLSKIGSGLPTELECEDAMFLLKQYRVTYPKGGNGASNVMLKDLMDNIIKGISFSVIDNINLGSFRVSDATPSMVLDKLKSEYGLFSYIRNGELYVGFANDASNTDEAEFVMEEVVINAEDLEYQTEDSVKIRVKAISIKDDNSKIEVEAGDADGEQKTIHKYNMSEADLKQVAEKYVKEFKYTGFVGELETFGEPIMKHGDRCKLTSTKLPERNGVYLIKGVKRVYGVDKGNHQIFKLGAKVG